MSDERRFGHIELVGKDIAVPGQKFDKIALSGRGELLLVSVIAETHNIKRMRAIFCGGAKATVTAGGIKVKQPSQQDWYAHSPGKLSLSGDGYQCHTHKLGYGLAHALFLSRTDGFMKVVSPESLWQEVSGPRFTTPIIREWMPYVERQLRDQELLEEAHCFGCSCGVLSAVTHHLDEIVCEGIKSGEILIPGSALAMTA